MKPFSLVFLITILLAIIFIVLLKRNYNSNENKCPNYSAYFIDKHTKTAIDSLFIKDGLSYRYALTDKNGYFKITKPDNSLNELIVYKDSTYCDTFRIQYRHPEGTVCRRFLGEKIYLNRIVRNDK